MTTVEPVGEVDARFSSVGATAVPWEEARTRLEDAKLYWVSTVRPDGRPHVTPLLAVWHDGAMWFCTGPDERKARNLAFNPHCVLTTGSNDLDRGLDLVVEGQARRVEDESVLHRVARLYEARFGPEWHFEVRDGAFHSDPGRALVYGVAPTTVFGFRKGEYSQTRWRFPRQAALQPDG